MIKYVFTIHQWIARNTFLTNKMNAIAAYVYIIYFLIVKLYFHPIDSSPHQVQWFGIVDVMHDNA